MMRLRLFEFKRSFGHAPVYFALAGEYFQQFGLNVDMMHAAQPRPLCQVMLFSEADVVIGPPVRIMLHHQSDPASPLVCFAQIVARDPSVLIGRTPNDRFRFDDLRRNRITVAAGNLTSWLSLQDDLIKAGINPLSLDRTPDWPMERAMDALMYRETDVVQVSEPYTEQLVQAGFHIWHRFSDRGDIGYTTFGATREYVENKREHCRRLVQGMALALHDFYITPAGDIARAIASYFPGTQLDLLTRIITNCRMAELWARKPDLPVTAFVRLKSAVLSGGLINKDFPFELLVDSGLSRADPV